MDDIGRRINRSSHSFDPSALECGVTQGADLTARDCCSALKNENDFATLRSYLSDRAVYVNRILGQYIVAGIADNFK